METQPQWRSQVILVHAWLCDSPPNIVWMDVENRDTAGVLQVDVPDTLSLLGHTYDVVGVACHIPGHWYAWCHHARGMPWVRYDNLSVSRGCVHNC